MGLVTVGVIIRVVTIAANMRFNADMMFDMPYHLQIWRAVTWWGPAVLVALLVWWLAKRRALPAIAILVAAASLGAALMHWDLRSPWTRYVETAWGRPHPFRDMIEPKAQVFWYHDLGAPWLLLQRPAYYAIGQGSGSLFNRDTAIDYESRRDLVARLQIQEQQCAMLAEISGGKAECAPDREAVTDLCADAQGQLDYIILKNRVEGLPSTAWTFQPSGDVNETRFHLYSCRAVGQAG
jgi:hypothetical protein